MMSWNAEHELGYTVTPWVDPGAGNRKQSLFDLTYVHEQKSKCKYTAAVNASMMKTSWSRSAAKAFNKAIVVDIRADIFACD